MSRTSSAIAFLVILVVVTAVALAFGRERSPVGSTDGEPAADGGVVAALCDVVAELEVGNPEVAAQAFFDGAHDGIHDFAGRFEQTDRGLMGRILVEKGRVEAAFADTAFSNAGASSADTAESIRSLLDLIAPPGDADCVIGR